MELKYIITDKGDFAIFTKLSNHSDVACGLYGKPVGAGFCNFAVGYTGKTYNRTVIKTGKIEEVEENNVNIHCYGESLSLNISSREEDEGIINNKIKT